MGVSVLLRLVRGSFQLFNTAYAFLRIHEQNSIFKDTSWDPMFQKEMKYNLRYGEVLYNLNRRQ